MPKLQRPFTYVSHLPKNEQILFWISIIGVIGIPVGALWLILNDENPGDGSGYLWVFPLVFPIIALSYRLIIKGVRVAGEKRQLTDEENKYLSNMEKVEKSLREIDWNKKSRFQIWAERAYLVLIGFILLVVLFLLFG